MKSVLVIAPHPDDETLGCGGTILRHIADGDEVHWLIATTMTPEYGYSASRIQLRAQEIGTVRQRYGIKRVYQLNFPAAQLDAIPLSEIIGKFIDVFAECTPHTVYTPNPGDVHSDHSVVFEASTSCSKWTRSPSVKSVRVYETLSETELGMSPIIPAWNPNLFIDITDHLDAKISIMRLYGSEFKDFPFPRSEEAIRSQAKFRGTAAGVTAAESFTVLREII